MDLLNWLSVSLSVNWRCYVTCCGCAAMKSVAPCRSSMISAHAPKEKKEEEKLEQEEEREE